MSTSRRTARRAEARAGKICPVCEKPFTPKRSNGTYCSVKCRVQAYRDRGGTRTEGLRDPHYRILLALALGDQSNSAEDCPTFPRAEMVERAKVGRHSEYHIKLCGLGLIEVCRVPMDGGTGSLGSKPTIVWADYYRITASGIDELERHLSKRPSA